MQHDHMEIAIGRKVEELNSPNVVIWTSGTNVGRFQWFYDIFDLNLVHRLRNRQPSDRVVMADTVNQFKNRLDKHWANYAFLYDYRVNYNGIGSLFVV